MDKVKKYEIPNLGDYLIKYLRENMKLGDEVVKKGFYGHHGVY